MRTIYGRCEFHLLENTFLNLFKKAKNVVHKTKIIDLKYLIYMFVFIEDVKVKISICIGKTQRSS